MRSHIYLHSRLDSRLDRWRSRLGRLSVCLFICPFIWPLICLSVLALGASGCCGDTNPPGAGSNGHVCRHGWLGWSGWCDEGLGCVDDVCTPCGYEGQSCCNDDSYTCLDGMSCDTSADESGIGICTAGCGNAGQNCCEDNTCPGSGTCNSDGKCESGGADDSCFTGSTPYLVYIVDPQCGYIPLTLLTNTIEEAETCRQQIIDNGSGNIEVSELGGAPPTLSSVCREGDGFAYQFWHYGDSQLAACEAQLCSCTWTSADANGACP